MKSNLITHFIISSWLWSLTHGWSHLVICWLFMTIGLVSVARMKFFYAFIYGVVAQLFALAALWFVAQYLLLCVLEVPYDIGYQLTKNRLLLALGYALLLSVLQMLFFVMLRLVHRFSVRSVIGVVLLSNLGAALSVYRLLPKM